MELILTSTSNMTGGSFAEASRCPKCETPGEDRRQLPAPKAANLPRGTIIHLIYCVNNRCRWFDTAWQVQVNSDGSVPAPKNHSLGPKIYAGIDNHDDIARSLIESLKQASNAQTIPGAEVRNKFS